MTQPPMTDFEKQRRMDIEDEARRVVGELDNVHVLELNEDDPFTYTKDLLTAICKATGQTLPTDDEIREIIEKAKNQVDGKY